MESDPSSFFLLFLTTIIINFSLTSASPPPAISPTQSSPPPPLPQHLSATTPSPSSFSSPIPLLLSPPPPSTLSSQQQPPISPPPPQQLNNIVDALIGAGDFTNWASIISMANPLSLPLSATFFIPEDDAFNGLPTMDPFMFPYHIVPQRLIFSDLLLFKPNSRLPTLLPGKSIIITSAFPSNFTLDNSLLTHPDLYTTSTLAVHGVGTILDYSAYGDGLTLFPTPNQPEVLTPPPPFMPIGQAIGWRSDAACLCTEFPIVFVIFFGVLVFKIQRNPLAR